MGKRRSFAAVFSGEGHQPIAATYAELPVGGTGHVRLEDCSSLEAFQAAFAAADEWAASGLIEILEIQEHCEAGWLIHPIRFRRLK